MSEQKSFMQQLDEWSDATIIMPLADPNQEDNFDVVVEQVKKAIREKVLESYRNGKAAPAGVKSQPSNFRPRRQSSK